MANGARSILVTTIVGGIALFSMGGFIAAMSMWACSESVPSGAAPGDICGNLGTDRASALLAFAPPVLLALTAILSRRVQLVEAAFVALLGVEIIVLAVVLLEAS